jgi:hypothetical protein
MRTGLLILLLLLSSCSYEPLHTSEEYDYCKALQKEQQEGQIEIYLPAYCDKYN